ncbi:hypothetical protein L1887_03634 [Cichorium endivia]|nr:hypothetical protein L1887_03634 [Cichorium endivia]
MVPVYISKLENFILGVLFCDMPPKQPYKLICCFLIFRSLGVLWVPIGFAYPFPFGMVFSNEEFGSTFTQLD